MATCSADLKCSICLSIYTDPVTLCCGHTYCQDCITKTWVNQNGGETTCPTCRYRFNERPELKRNIKLCNKVKLFLSAQPERDTIFCTYCVYLSVPASKTCLHCEASFCDVHLAVHSKSEEHILSEPTSSLEKRKCSVHKKMLEFCCSEDGACICISCCQIGEHKEHKVELLSHASERKKEKLRNILEKLISKQGKVEKKVENMQKRMKEVPEKGTGIKHRIIALFRDIREHLGALEKRLLGEISGQQEKISLQLSDLIQQLEMKKDELSRNIHDLEELCNMADPLTVLQELESRGTALYGAEREIDAETDGNETVPAAHNFDEFLILMTLKKSLGYLVDTFPRLQDKHGLRVLPCSDIYLHIGTTTDNRIDLSSDAKMATYTAPYPQEDSPEKYLSCQVLSTSSFQYGQYYWEVEVSQTGDCRIGVTYPGTESNKGFLSVLGYNNKSWCLRKYYKDYSVLHNGEKDSVLCKFSSSDWIGVFLDYNAGRLSFYLLSDPVRHLHTFSSTFTEPLYPVFYIYNGWVRMCK